MVLVSLSQSMWVSHHRIPGNKKLWTANFVSAEDGSPCLRAVFTLTRNYGYQVIQTYVPSFFVISLSWVGFWIPADSVPARMTLGMSTVTTIIFQWFYGALLYPRVSWQIERALGYSNKYVMWESISSWVTPASAIQPTNFQPLFRKPKGFYIRINCWISALFSKPGVHTVIVHVSSVVNCCYTHPSSIAMRNGYTPMCSHNALVIHRIITHVQLSNVGRAFKAVRNFSRKLLYL